MTAIDPLKLAAAVKKLVGEVADVREENKRLDEILSTALNTLGTELAAILDGSIADVKAENERLRQDNEELRADITHLQGLIAGHEVAIVEITGKPTEIIHLQEPEAKPQPDLPKPVDEKMKDFSRHREYEQARANLDY